MCFSSDEDADEAKVNSAKTKKKENAKKNAGEWQDEDSSSDSDEKVCFY